MAHKGRLPAIQRYITTHDSEGKATFSDSLSVETTMKALPGDDAAFALGYTTSGFPIDTTDGADIKAYSEHLVSPPGITVSGGSVLRYVDMAPGVTSPMHRTLSLDYGVVLEGEVELILDSGEKRLMKHGNVAVQRGTNHAWRNTSETEWARMMYVLLPCKPIEIGGKSFSEDLGTMEGVRASD